MLILFFFAASSGCFFDCESCNKEQCHIEADWCVITCLNTCGGAWGWCRSYCLLRSYSRCCFRLFLVDDGYLCIEIIFIKQYISIFNSYCISESVCTTYQISFCICLCNIERKGFIRYYNCLCTLRYCGTACKIKCQDVLLCSCGKSCALFVIKDTCIENLITFQGISICTKKLLGYIQSRDLVESIRPFAELVLNVMLLFAPSSVTVIACPCG